MLSFKVTLFQCEETERCHMAGEGIMVCQIIEEGFCLCEETKPEFLEKIVVPIVLCGGKEIQCKQ